jgi:hypothetical protein
MSSRSGMEKMDGRLDVMDVRLDEMGNSLRNLTNGMDDIRKMFGELMANKDNSVYNIKENAIKDILDLKSKDLQINTDKIFTECEEHIENNIHISVNGLLCNDQTSKDIELITYNDNDIRKCGNQDNNNFIQDGCELVYFAVYDDVIPMTMEEYMEYEMEISNEVSEDISYEENYVSEKTISQLYNLCKKLGQMLEKKFDVKLSFWKQELIYIGNKISKYIDIGLELYGSENLYEETVNIQKKILRYEDRYKKLSTEIESYIKSSIINVTSSKCLSNQKYSLTNKLPTLNVSDKLVKESTNINISENKRFSDNVFMETNHEKDGLISYGNSDALDNNEEEIEIVSVRCDDMEVLDPHKISKNVSTGTDLLIQKFRDMKVDLVKVCNYKTKDTKDTNDSILEVHSPTTIDNIRDMMTPDSVYDTYLELGDQLKISEKAECNIGNVQFMKNDMIYKSSREVDSSNTYSQTTNISDGMLVRKLFHEDADINVISNTNKVSINTSSDNIQSTDGNLILSNMVISGDYTYKGNIDYMDGLDNKSIIDDYAYKDICRLGSISYKDVEVVNTDAYIDSYRNNDFLTLDSNSGITNNIDHIRDSTRVGENSNVMFSNDANHEGGYRGLLYNDNNLKVNGDNNIHIINSTYTWNDLDFNKASKYIKGRHGFEDILMGTHIYV